jgi:hypothetical protein
MNLFLAAGVVIAACALSAGLMFAVHAFGSREVLLKDTTRGAGVYAVVGTSFAVLLAFVVLIAFQNYNEGKEGADAEANSVIELFRSAAFFPAEPRRELQGEVVCYARAVIEHDWPAMGDGGRSAVVDSWSLAIQRTSLRLPVRTPREEAAFDDLLGLRDARLEARRERVAQADSEVTAPVWFILLLGAGINIAFVLVFIDRRDEALGVQVGLIASVTAIVVAGLLLVWFLDHPYEGQSGSIEPAAMRNAIAAMEEEGPDVSAPCTASGDPRSA